MAKSSKPLKEKYSHLQALYRVTSVMDSSSEPKDVLNKILSEAVKLMKARSGSFILIDPNSGLLDIEASMGLTNKAQRIKLKLGEGITGWVAAHAKPLRVADVKNEPRYIRAIAGTRSEMAVPVVIRGNLIGVINVDSDRLDAFSAVDQELLEALAAQSARVLQNVWLVSQLRDKAAQLETLFNVGQTIVSAVSVEEVLRIVTEKACKLTRTPMCSIMLLTSGGQELKLAASHGASRQYSHKPNLPIKESLLGVVITRKKPLAILDVRESQRYHHLELAKREKLVSLLSVPLIYGTETVGALSVYTRVRHRFSNDEIKILSALASLSAIAIEKARLYSRVLEVEELLRTNERLSALGLLAAEIAHEIRNPLAVMQMLFYPFEHAFENDPARRKDAEIIAAKMKHMNSIVDQILSYARSTEPTIEPRSVPSIFEDLQLLVRHKLTSHDVKLVVHHGENVPEVPADKAQIEQALLNLILNAVQAMPQGGTLTLSSRLVQKRGKTYAALTVADTGEGMVERVRAALFQPFLTTKPKGTGIGLAIVHKIIEHHRGFIEVESTLGKGSSFSLFIPIHVG
ncbi:MAG: GAF domain-containing protein [Verrucomicrobiota bacterium]|nr:GAF domain-containing protein [Verrucomicrobiota bacterium]